MAVGKYKKLSILPFLSLLALKILNDRQNETEKNKK